MRLSTTELIEVLDAMQHKLRTIRTEDTDGWVPRIKLLLAGLELELYKAIQELES